MVLRKLEKGEDCLMLSREKNGSRGRRYADGSNFGWNSNFNISGGDDVPEEVTIKISTPGPTDYYALLSLDRNASTDEITRAWRRLVLLHHPDKQLNEAGRPNSDQGEKVDIRLVNESRWVLSDPSRRREWEEAFYERGQAVEIPLSTTPHISHHISLSDFTPHYTQTSDGDPGHALEGESGEEGEPAFYTHPCRCSGQFCITFDDLIEGIEVIGCEGCGEWIKVGYEAIEEDDSHPEEQI